MEALMEKERAGEAAERQEYVSFFLNDELYAFEALKVREIVELMNITNVPHLPEFIKGVINLRGNIIPVVDLKLKFGMNSGEYRKHTCIIVTEFSGGVMGLIVDVVSDVLTLSKETIAAAPSFGASINTAFIKGMGKVGDSLVIVLDVDRVLSETETLALGEAKNISPSEGGQDA